MTAATELKTEQSRMLAGEPFYQSYDSTNKKRTYSAYFDQNGFVVGALIQQTQAKENRTDGKSVYWTGCGEVLVPSSPDGWIRIHYARNVELEVDAVSFGDEAAIIAALRLDARHVAAVAGQLWRMAANTAAQVTV